MYQFLLYTHSIGRYFVLFLLLVVVLKSFTGWRGRKPFTKGDDKFSLFLLIFTHIQFLAGLALYFVSPFVQFNSGTMKEHDTRYWTVEHIFAMLIAVALITIARITSKKLSEHTAKHKRLFILNFLALVIIVVMISLSGRGLMASALFK